jgi:hypothetical protein
LKKKFEKYLSDRQIGRYVGGPGSDLRVLSQKNCHERGGDKRDSLSNRPGEQERAERGAPRGTAYPRLTRGALRRSPLLFPECWVLVFRFHFGHELPANGVFGFEGQRGLEPAHSLVAMSLLHFDNGHIGYDLDILRITL